MNRRPGSLFSYDAYLQQRLITPHLLRLIAGGMLDGTEYQEPVAAIRRAFSIVNGVATSLGETLSAKLPSDRVLPQSALFAVDGKLIVVRVTSTQVVLTGEDRLNLIYGISAENVVTLQSPTFCTPEPERLLRQVNHYIATYELEFVLDTI